MTTTALRADDIDAVICIEGLVKDDDKVHTICGIDLSVHRGEVFGFLDPNGSGARWIRFDRLPAQE